MILRKKVKPTVLVPSTIAAGMHVSGDIEVEGAVEISGRVDGDIKCLSVKINKGALVNGDVFAERIDIEGEVVGEVRGRFVKCSATSKIIGNIIHIFLTIENGAYIDGSCRKHITDELRMLPNYGAAS